MLTLRQSRNSYRHYQAQIAVCDEEIEKLIVDNRIQAFIKAKSTAIHPSVDWRFRTAVLRRS